ncbi:COX15/CtaA family protein [Demequina capsici]|uniref:COX15/CtaA family protein n=1 Tax=Demequina capsici TaxID=3075620 RepID=A0AA96FD37_9MICO|nr:COX15/CtaA family protein [Demequina sp. PMTSA13]WNM26120.1 COX15/CtaA family protein [Demequina sp. PMTSA13]
MSTTDQSPAAAAKPFPVRLWRSSAGLLGRHTRGLTIANIVTQSGIIVTGGAVRLTGSGLGCSTWPQCEPGEFTPEAHSASGIHPFIEFGNRTLTGVLLVVAILLAIGVWNSRSDLKWWGLVPGLGVIAQAVLGGITVLVQLNPLVVAPHLLLSMLLVWQAVWLALTYRRAPRRAGAPLATLRWISVALLIGVLFMGVLTTGAGPHSGDADATDRLALSPAHVAKIHAMVVWAFVAVLLLLVYRLRGDRSAGDRDEVRKAWIVLVAITFAQAAIGYVQYFTGLPEVIVGTHLLGAAALTAAHSAFFYLTKAEQEQG